MKFETQDFYLSAFLCLKGVEIVQIKGYGARKLFVFEDTAEFQALKRDYYWHKAKVDPETNSSIKGRDYDTLTNLNT